MTTLQDELITDVRVPREELDQIVASYAVIANTCIYIDGRMLTPDELARFLKAYQETFARPCTAPAPPAAPLPSPQEVVSWMDIFRRGLEDVHRGYEEVRKAAAQSHQEMQAAMRAATEMHIEMQRELADEAVRQRKLTAQSLGDIDLLHRAVKTAEMNHALASMKAASGLSPRGEGGVQALARREDQMTVGDLLRGVIDLRSK